ncbi:hypothetical protein KBD45_06850 [Candidatus Dojkabacteria bacterium]|nr:hypothetical protein [Candidatus Dojkabacteria bacterium]
MAVEYLEKISVEAIHVLKIVDQLKSLPKHIVTDRRRDLLIYEIQKGRVKSLQEAENIILSQHALSMSPTDGITL